MAKSFKTLQAKMSPEARARSEDKANQMIREMALDELRGALDLTQQHLAELLHVKQAAISKVERRSDMYISTLRKIIEAMGGQLDIRAILPEGIVRINQFEEIRKPARARPSPARGEASVAQTSVFEACGSWATRAGNNC